jgi:O-antigen/teichoic acid export membrane protein
VFKKIVFHSALYSLSSILTQAASLLMLPFLTPHLTAFDYGVYGIIMSYLFFITSLKDLGFGVVFVNTYFRYPKRWPIIWRMLYGHLIYWSIFYFFLLAVVVYIALPATELHNFKYVLLLTAVPSVILDNANTIANYYYRFTENPKVIATVGIAAGLISIGATYYCIVDLKIGYMGWFVGTFLTSLVTFLCFLYPVYFKLKLTPILRFKKRFIKKHLRVSLPMIPHNYSSYLLNSSDRVVMDLMKVNISQVGLYNMAYRFGSAFEIMGEAVGMAVGPHYVKLYMSNTREGLEDARRLTYLLTVCFIAVAFLVSLWLKQVFELLINNASLKGAYDVGIIIFMGYCYRPMYWCTVNKLSSFDKTAVLWRISFVAGLLNLILNIIFVGRFGIYAAAVITFISLMFVGFAGFYLKSYKKLKGVNHYPMAWLLLITVLTILVYYLRDISYLYKTIITIVTIGAVFQVMKSNFKAGAIGKLQVTN